MVRNSGPSRLPLTITSGSLPSMLALPILAGTPLPPRSSLDLKNTWLTILAFNKSKLNVQKREKDIHSFKDEIFQEGSD